ncbi:MAG: hypothetical protein RL417_2574 [Pseudomonadota bacterium]|jgi:xanthosine utilization system XapX-like protein
MNETQLTRTVERVKGLSSHALTGTLWAVGKAAFLEGLAIVLIAVLFERAAPDAPVVTLVGVLGIFIAGSYWTTHRHKRDHLQHSAIVSAVVLVSSFGTLLWRGTGFGIICGFLLAAFLALFYGYRCAFK